MTVTLPTDFERQKFNNVGTAALAVKITNNNGDVFWFAEKCISYSANTTVVEALLYDISPITHGYDYNTLEYQPSHCTCTIANLWSRVQRGGYYHRRVSDVLTGGQVLGLWGQSLKVIWYSGGYSQDVSGLVVFDGTIVQIDMDGDDKLTLQCDEIWNSRDKMLPQRLATRAEFRNLPVENIDVSLPLVYGPHNELAFLRNTGFAVGLRVDSFKWVIADHPVFAFYDEPRPPSSAGGAYSSTTKAVWIYLDSLKSWARSYVGVTFSVNDSGRATALIDPDAAGFDVYIYPTKCTPTSTAVDLVSPNNVGPSAAYDYNKDSKLSIIANSDNQAEVIFEWDIMGDVSDHDQLNDVAELPGPIDALYGWDGWISKPGGVTITSSSVQYWDGFNWTGGNTLDVTTDNMIHYNLPLNVFYGSAGAMRWHLATGMNNEVGGSDKKPFKIRIRFNGTNWAADNTIVAYIHELRLLMSCKLPRNNANILYQKRIVLPTQRPGEKAPRLGGFNPLVNVADVSFSVLGASVLGRKHAYESDHTAEPWNDGDQITNPAGVIESILVDELGFNTATDLHTDSFDEVYNAPTVRASVISLKPGSRISSKEFLDRICFEHALVLYRGRESDPAKFKLVEAVGRESVAATIRRSELMGLPNIAFTPFDPTNIITFRYRRLPHDNQFFKSETFKDVTSTTEYGEFTEEIGLETIANGVYLPAIKQRLITINYLRSRPHYLVDFVTTGCRYAHLELGDKVQFESESLDEVLGLYGQSWQGVSFTIFEATVLKNAHAFKAINLVPEPAKRAGVTDCGNEGSDAFNNQITGYRIDMPERGRIERILVCMSFAGDYVTRNVKCAIYTHEATPALIPNSETDERTFVEAGVVNARRWEAFTYGVTNPTGPILNPGSYYVCGWGISSDDPGGSGTGVEYNSLGGTGRMAEFSLYSAGFWPSLIFTPTLTPATRKLSFYMEYTPV